MQGLKDNSQSLMANVGKTIRIACKYKRKFMANCEKYLNTKEAAKLLKVSVRTLRRYYENGIIPYTKPMGRYYFKKSQLTAFINNEL